VFSFLQDSQPLSASDAAELARLRPLVVRLRGDLHKGESPWSHSHFLLPCRAF
jgi:hypothetical protein